MVLESIYEEDFLDCSYGFRPGRSAHQAVERLWQGLMTIGGGWVIDLDIQSFFDNVERAHLRSFLDQRVRDGVIRRAINKWLKAGVMEKEQPGIRKKEPLKVGWSAPCFQMSICTKCWTSGSTRRCNRG